MKFGKLSSGVTLESFNNARKPTTTFFYYGCNFACGYCHNNKLLAKVSDESKLLTEEEVKNIVKNSKRTWKKMISISGGEPTLDPNLETFIRYLRDWGFEIKLDTNGSNPEVLEKLFADNLIDYVAMDIKGTPEQYEKIAKYTNIEKIKKSIELIQTLNDYEFRTTVIPTIHEVSDIEEIGKWLNGSKRYVLQCFKPDLEHGCLNKSYCDLPKWPKEKLEPYKEAVESCFDEVKIK